MYQLPHKREGDEQSAPSRSLDDLEASAYVQPTLILPVPPEGLLQGCPFPVLDDAEHAEGQEAEVRTAPPARRQGAASARGKHAGGHAAAACARPRRGAGAAGLVCRFLLGCQGLQARPVTVTGRAASLGRCMRPAADGVPAHRLLLPASLSKQDRAFWHGLADKAGLESQSEVWHALCRACAPCGTAHTPAGRSSGAGGRAAPDNCPQRRPLPRFGPPAPGPGAGQGHMDHVSGARPGWAACLKLGRVLHTAVTVPQQALPSLCPQPGCALHV